MREKKYYVWFDSLDRGTMINCKRQTGRKNGLAKVGKPAD